MDEPSRSLDVQRAAAGDADALQRLIVHYHGPLRGRIQGLIHHEMRSRVDPDDVLQQAYVAAFRTVASCRFDGPAAFYGWLETIAVSRLRDQERAWRQEKRDVAREAAQPPSLTASLPALIDRLSASEPTPSRRMAHKEAVAALMSSLARLSDDQRTVVRLRFLEGRSVAEIAQRLGKSEPAIHMLCHRGLKALRTLMQSITSFLSGM